MSTEVSHPPGTVTPVGAWSEKTNAEAPWSLWAHGSVGLNLFAEAESVP